MHSLCVHSSWSIIVCFGSKHPFVFGTRSCDSFKTELHRKEYWKVFRKQSSAKCASHKEQTKGTLLSKKFESHARLRQRRKNKHWKKLRQSRRTSKLICKKATTRQWNVFWIIWSKKTANDWSKMNGKIVRRTAKAVLWIINFNAFPIHCLMSRQRSETWPFDMHRKITEIVEASLCDIQSDCFRYTQLSWLLTFDQWQFGSSPGLYRILDFSFFSSCSQFTIFYIASIFRQTNLFHFNTRPS